VNHESLVAAYQAAGGIAHSLGILQVLRPKASNHATVADGISKFARQVVLATRQLGQIKEIEAEVFQEAASLYTDVVRCGNRAGHSYLDLAFRFGEIATMSFLPHSDSIAKAWLGLDSSGLDASGVVSAWNVAENWFSYLDEFGIGLDVALEKELHRLKGEVKMPAEVEPPAPSFSVKVIGNIIVIEGEEFPVQPHHANWVKMLLEAREVREKVTGEQLTEVSGCRGKNLSREFKRLFKAVPLLADLITAVDGHGGGWYFNR